MGKELIYQPKYEGDVKKGNPDGKGKHKLTNGNKYVSELKDGKHEGKGTFTLSNGDEYSGEFKNRLDVSLKNNRLAI